MGSEKKKRTVSNFDLIIRNLSKLRWFKDSKNLEEYELFFLNETSEEITKFYLEIAEQEFLPIDIEIDGSLYTNEKKQKILEVSDFYITFIQGCDEQ